MRRHEQRASRAAGDRQQRGERRAIGAELRVIRRQAIGSRRHHMPRGVRDGQRLAEPERDQRQQRDDAPVAAAGREIRGSTWLR